MGLPVLSLQLMLNADVLVGINTGASPLMLSPHRVSFAFGWITLIAAIGPPACRRSWNPIENMWTHLHLPQILMFLCSILIMSILYCSGSSWILILAWVTETLNPSCCLQSDLLLSSNCSMASFMRAVSSCPSANLFWPSSACLFLSANAFLPNAFNFSFLSMTSFCIFSTSWLIPWVSLLNLTCHSFAASWGCAPAAWPHAMLTISSSIHDST